MIIAIAGTPGSGKSTLGKDLARALGWPRHYIGGLRREKARERGLTLQEYNKLGETDPSTDREVDEYQAELARNEDNFVIEGYTSWHFIPRALKIFLYSTEEKAAERIFNDLKADPAVRNEGRALETYDQVLASLRTRMTSDRFRYRKHYDIDVYDPENHDLAIDTTMLSPEETLTKVLEFIKTKN